MALYRKHRPAIFADLVGQEHVTEPLMQALRNDRVHHAYLFSGPRGCGKTSSARILARSLNCEAGPTPEPCGTCEQCVAIRSGSSLDVVEIDAASHRGIDDAKDLRERAFYAPVSARFKVYIIDEAHQVTSDAFNALLKLVEEPPDHVKFIFATTEPEKVIATIKSRTHHYPFRLVPPKKLAALLNDVATREGVDVDPRALQLVVRAGAGSARDALSVLDQLVAGAGDHGVTYELARDLLGVTDGALLDELVDAVAARDGGTVFDVVARVVEAGHDPRRFASDLLDRFKDLIVVQRVPEALERGLIDCAPDLGPRLSQQAAAMGPAELSRAADLLYAGLTEMRGTTSPRLTLELVCARILLPAAATDDSSVLARVDRLERRLDIVGDSATAGPAPTAPSTRAAAAAAKSPSPAAPPPDRVPAAAAPARNGSAESPPVPSQVPPSQVPPAPAPATPTPAAPAESSTGQVDAAAVRRVWDQVLEAIGRRSRTVRSLLDNAMVTAVTDRELTLCFKYSPLVAMFEREPNPDHVAAALREVIGVDWRVRAVFKDDAGDCVVEASGPGAAQPADRPAPAQPAGSATDDFAPGDEPAEEPDGAAEQSAPRRTGEDPAVALLRTSLGAQVISQRDAE
ncbi:MAG TPA: DNA polymerase III subunit gamma and tau [Mycobacteriales bacterium]|nr:DNA polymerase III subunit gamma and tau [Mycobacteriales bacterium]